MTWQERFWRKVQRGLADECWPWLGTTRGNGYGAFRLGRMLSAHRVSWELSNGPVPDGLHVCHSCDYPGCCNPGHLFVGTAQDNARDKVLKGRQAGLRKGVAHHKARLCPARVMDVRWQHLINSRSMSDLAAEYGVTRQAIWHVVHSRSWRSVS